MTWIDVSVPIMNGMVNWPGDPPVEVGRRLKIEDGSDFNISFVKMSSHTGTHMDAPLHFIPGADGLEKMPIEAVVGPARVIEISDPVSIKVPELESNDIGAGMRVLFKTANSSRNWPELEFLEDYVYLEKESAEYLAGRGVLTVGVDYLSVSALGEEAVATHVALLGSGVWIIEGLYLEGVEPGEYDMACLPLPLVDADGAPARVIIRPAAGRR